MDQARIIDGLGCKITLKLFSRAKPSERVSFVLFGLKDSTVVCQELSLTELSLTKLSLTELSLTELPLSIIAAAQSDLLDVSFRSDLFFQAA
jgi:hypothetical protein